MTQLQLMLVNNSGKPGNLIIFQRYGNTPNSLAWVSKYAYPGTQFAFRWDPWSYCYVWSGSGNLGPGIEFDAAQTVPASPTDTNLVPFSYDAEHKTFFFGAPERGPQQGVFTIRSDVTVPPNSAVVGIGMAGKATFLTNAQPNFNVAIEPRATYWVAFGNYKQGELIEDVDAIKAVQVTFPPRVVAMTATVAADGSWTIEENVLDKQPAEEA